MYAVQNGQSCFKVSRSINRFNVENRAHRVLQKEKQERAPLYRKDEDIIKTLEADPSISERLHKKDISLYDRLKKVYVTSENEIINPIQNKSSKNIRSLPLDREPVQEFEFGVKEPIKISSGYVTLRQVLKFMEDNRTDSKTWTSEAIAKYYKLETTEVDNILKYYNIFQVYIPDKKKSKVLFASAFKSDPLRLKEKSNNSEK